MPEKAVRTRASSGPGSRRSNPCRATERGATNHSARAAFGLFMCPDRLSRGNEPMGSAQYRSPEWQPSVRARGGRMAGTRELARVTLPTAFGEFDAHAFESAAGVVHLALVKGRIARTKGVLTRLHSECLTGDALGSLRCDCGMQLRLALQTIAAAGEGVLVYAIGHEGR